MLLLAEAHRAWERMRPLREKRERNKNFTYGNQWCDMMTDEHGRRVSEWQHLRDNGKDPLTNNLIRQLVKSVVGRFRSRLAAEPAPAEPLHGNLVGELDSRLMEEFLISGCCFQRIDFGEEGRVALSNVSPSQMLFRGGETPAAATSTLSVSCTTCRLPLLLSGSATAAAPAPSTSAATIRHSPTP